MLSAPEGGPSGGCGKSFAARLLEKSSFEFSVEDRSGESCLREESGLLSRAASAREGSTEGLAAVSATEIEA